LNKVALSVQPGMKKDLREVYLAPNRASAETAIGVFAEKYGAKHGKAVECLTKEREALLAFYDFPAEHWDHLRTTNPIESVFATVRYRNGADQRLFIINNCQVDGVQAAQCRIKDLAPAERNKSIAISTN
jgi:transposase-like protein